MTCCHCTRPALFRCTCCGAVWCGFYGCRDAASPSHTTATHPRAGQSWWWAAGRVYHQTEPIEPIPDTREFRTGPLAYAARPEPVREATPRRPHRRTRPDEDSWADYLRSR